MLLEFKKRKAEEEKEEGQREKKKREGSRRIQMMTHPCNRLNAKVNKIQCH